MSQQMHPIEALKSIETMAGTALETNDMKVIRRQLEMIAVTVRKALPRKTELRRA
jgi:hypothetical protein